MTEVHVGAVVQVGGRYPFKPSCSCGWTTWGYAAAHAAQIMADDHVSPKPACPPIRYSR